MDLDDGERNTFDCRWSRIEQLGDALLYLFYYALPFSTRLTSNDDENCLKMEKILHITHFIF